MTKQSCLSSVEKNRPSPRKSGTQPGMRDAIVDEQDPFFASILHPCRQN